MRCFVISPIGVPGSDIREHADDVFDFIIKPACERAGVKPERADHDTRPGVITEQMYDAILGHDLLIAVLSFHNPNVFYEIAIAEAAARPLILMIQAGDAIPFDIKDRRVLTYDLRPRALHNKLHEDALHRAILDTIAASQAGDRSVPFRPSLSPLGAHQESLRLLDRTSSLEAAARIASIQQAKTRVGLRGLALFSMPQRLALSGAAREAAKRGVSVKVLLMSPDSPALGHQLRNFASNYVQSVQGEIRSGIELWTSALDGCGEVRLQTSGVMSGMLQFNDHNAILTPYSVATSTADSPCLDIEADNPFYRAAIEEFDFVWKEASAPVQTQAVSGRKSGRKAGKPSVKKGRGGARRTLAQDRSFR